MDPMAIIKKTRNLLVIVSNFILMVTTKTIRTEIMNPTRVANAAPFMPYAGIKR